MVKATKGTDCQTMMMAATAKKLMGLISQEWPKKLMPVTCVST